MKIYKLYIKDKDSYVKVIERQLTTEHAERLENNIDKKDPNGYILLKIIEV